jgi:hypothetical protein
MKRQSVKYAGQATDDFPRLTVRSVSRRRIVSASPQVRAISDALTVPDVLQRERFPVMTTETTTTPKKRTPVEWETSAADATASVLRVTKYAPLGRSRDEVAEATGEPWRRVQDILRSLERAGEVYCDAQGRWWPTRPDMPSQRQLQKAIDAVFDQYGGAGQRLGRLSFAQLAAARGAALEQIGVALAAEFAKLGVAATSGKRDLWRGELYNGALPQVRAEWFTVVAAPAPVPAEAAS